MLAKQIVMIIDVEEDGIGFVNSELNQQAIYQIRINST
jgi:hypothetical protein